LICTRRAVNIWFVQGGLFWTSKFSFLNSQTSYISNMSCSWATLRILKLYQRPSHCLWKYDASFFMQVSYLYTEDFHWLSSLIPNYCDCDRNMLYVWKYDRTIKSSVTDLLYNTFFSSSSKCCSYNIKCYWKYILGTSRSHNSTFRIQSIHLISV